MSKVMKFSQLDYIGGNWGSETLILKSDEDSYDVDAALIGAVDLFVKLG